MASTNQSPFYKKAEEEYLKATTVEEKIRCLEVMIRECPKHKSSEKMLKNLKIRLKKLKEELFKKQKTSKKKRDAGFKKAELQCLLFGMPNSGKTSIFNLLTKRNEKVSKVAFTTASPRAGTFESEGAKIQIIDDAPFPEHDKNILNTADLLLIVSKSKEDIQPLVESAKKSPAKKIILLNKSDLLNEQEKRKIESFVKSKVGAMPLFFTSNKMSDSEIDFLKKELFKYFEAIRVYPKEPKKEPSKTPVILRPGSRIKEFSEKILKGPSKNVRIARIWGPSSSFGGQVVGINHKLKDKDIVELKTS